jgi:hypothetical protein
MIEGIPLTALSPLGVLLIFILFMALGKLVPRSFLDDARQDTERWRRAHEVSEASRAELAEQMKVLQAKSDATVALLESITKQAKKP